MRIPISIRTSSAMADIKGLVDSRATDCFMSPTIVKRMGLGKQPLEKPQRIWNIDNTENKDGSITHFVDLQVQTQGIHRTMRFLITNIGNEDVVLGYPWLATYEPKFNWKYATIDETTLPVVLRSVNPTRLAENQLLHIPRKKKKRLHEHSNHSVWHERQLQNLPYKPNNIPPRQRYPKNTKTSKKCLAKKSQNATLPKGHGTTQSNSKRMPLTPSTVKYTPKHKRKTKHYKNS